MAIPAKRPHNVHVHVPYAKIREYLPLLRQYCINPEVYADGDALDSVGPREAEEIVSLLDYNPSFTLHAPFMDLSPAAVDSKIRNATLDRLNQAMDIAGTLKARSIVMHSGYERWKFDSVGSWIEKSFDTWQMLSQRASAIGAVIAIENIFESRPDNLRQLMEAIALPHVGICFDTGHFNIFSKSPLGEWIDSLGPYIKELHLHDNMRDADSHLPIGDGTFDFDGLFKLLGKRDIVHTIEAHSSEDALTGIDRLNRYL